jgi:exosortase
MVSSWVDSLLYTAGYPISRSGVVLQVGQYQLLIANACSGLHSLIGLSAVGVMSVYLMRRTHPAHNILLLASIIPIAVLANVLRVTTLVLGTYHFGSDTGEHLHEIMGYLEILFAFVAFLVVDSVLGRVLREKTL